MSKICKNAEKQIYQEEVIKKFYKNINYDIILNNLQNYSIAIQSLVFLLDYIYKHNPNLIYNLCEPIFENYTNRLLLANHSLKQLNIIQDNRYSGKYSCVLNLLNNCITEMGKRKFQHNLLNPTTNSEELNISYDITEYLLKDAKIWKNFKNDLSEMRDIEKLKRKIILKKISPKDFVILFKNLDIIIKLHKISSCDPILCKFLNIKLNIDNILINSEKLKKKIKNFLNLKLSEFIDDFSPSNGFEKFLNFETEKLFFY